MCEGAMEWVIAGQENICRSMNNNMFGTIMSDG